MAISSMGKGNPPEGGSSGQGQGKGQRSGVETSRYGEHQGMVVSDPRNTRESGESHVSDSHVRATARQSKGPCHEAIPESPVLKSLSSHSGLCTPVRGPLIHVPIATRTFISEAGYNTRIRWGTMSPLILRHL